MPVSYAQLLDECFTQPPTLQEPPRLDLPDELTIQSHWFSGLFGRLFKTDAGREIEIVQFGFWNKAAGPDFLNAAVKIDGELHTGPIELDITPHHWELHDHHQNASFNDVILHVVCADSELQTFARTSDHRCVPRIVLTERQLVHALNLKPFTQTTAHFGRCSTPLAHLNEHQVTQVLESAAKYRIAQKATRTSLTADAHGVQQALWMQIAETLGYRPNRNTFKILAQRIPIAQLSKVPPEEIEAVLFGAAGFLHPDIHQNAPADSQAWLEELWETWWKLRQDFEVEESRRPHWTLSGNRPVNHPQRRLAALACVAKSWSVIIRAANHPERLEKLLLELTDAFWNHHYTLTSKRSEKRLKLIGKERVDALLINHILPGLIYHSDNDSAWQQYKSLPAPVVSENVNRASIRLLGQHPQREEFLRKAWHHQALLQLYQDFCLKDASDCADCPFPERLQSWAAEF